MNEYYAVVGTRLRATWHKSPEAAQKRVREIHSPAFHNARILGPFKTVREAKQATLADEPIYQVC